MFKEKKQNEPILEQKILPNSSEANTLKISDLQKKDRLEVLTTSEALKISSCSRSKELASEDFFLEPEFIEGWIEMKSIEQPTPIDLLGDYLIQPAPGSFRKI